MEVKIKKVYPPKKRKNFRMGLVRGKTFFTNNWSFQKRI